MTNEEILKNNLSVTDSLKALFHIDVIYSLMEAARKDEAEKSADGIKPDAVNENWWSEWDESVYRSLIELLKKIQPHYQKPNT